MEKNNEDNWNADGEKELWDAWTGFTRFVLLSKGKATWWIHMVRWETYKKTNYLSSWRCMARYVEAHVWCRKEESKTWAIEKPKLDNARQLRGIFFIEPNDEEFKVTIKAARRKLEVSMPAAMPCKIPMKSSGKTHRNIWETQDKICMYCWCRRKHEIKARWSRTQISSISHHCKRDEFSDSLQSCSQVHSDASSNENSGCKGNRVKEWEKLKKIPAWQLTKVRNKKEVIYEARVKGRKVHFASLVDICQLENSELEPRYQKYKSRVVLWGDIVKDDSGAYAVFTEQGSSTSHMTAAKIMDIISRLHGCSGQAADAVSAYRQVKMEDASTLFKIPESEGPDIWIRLPKHK